MIRARLLVRPEARASLWRKVVGIMVVQCKPALMSSRMIAVVSCASWEVVGLADDLARIGATSELVVGFMDVQWTHATHGSLGQRHRERDLLSEVPSPAFLEDFCGELNQQRM